MNPREKAIFMKQRHGETALIQAQQCLAFDIFSDYWKKVVEILSKQ